MKKTEAQLAGLNRRHQELTAKLEAASLTDQQLTSFDALVTQVGKGLHIARQGFSDRRQIVEILDVTGTVSVEEGQQFVDARAVVGDALVLTERLTLVSVSPRTDSPFTYNDGAFAALIVNDAKPLEGFGVVEANQEPVGAR